MYVDSSDSPPHHTATMPLRMLDMNHIIFIIDKKGNNMGSNRINYEKEFIGKIHSYYKFIEIMKRLSDEEKFAFLYEYFYKNVSYNYLELLYSELCFNASSHGDPTYEEYHGELNPNNNYMLLCSFSKFGIYKDDEIYKYESEKPNIMQSIVELRK